MSTVEAAASLFGPDGDSGPDLFAVIGNEATDTTPPHDEHHTNTSSHSFHMGQDTSSWFVEQIYPDAQQERHDSWFIPTTQDPSSGQSNRPSGLSPSYDHHQHYYPEVSTYEPHSAYSFPPVTSGTNQSITTSYEAHNPTPPTHHQLYSINQYPVQQPYDPYKPATTTSISDSYAPRQQARQFPTVPAQPHTAQPDNHNPASRSVPSPYSASFAAASSQQPTDGVPVRASKPPTVPTAAEFRPKASNAYDPPLPPPKVHRATSPTSLRLASNSLGPVSHTSRPHMNPYDHKSTPGPPRTISPSSIRSASPASGSFAPSKAVPAYTSSQLRGRSTSNGSSLSSQGTLDLVQPRKEYGLGFGAHITEPSSYNGQSHHPMEPDIPISRVTRLPYAPSPSLLGSNDPLGRTSSRAPVISFGFGGKVLTCFQSTTDLNTGFDVALSSRRTTNVAIRVLHQLLPDYVYGSKATEYPGPLFSDPGSPVTSLVRTGTSQAKTKKARVIKYLEERAEEISRGAMYIFEDIERQRLEGKLALVQLLKIMVENDGSLSGSPAIDNAVRIALLPRIASTMDMSGRDGPVALSASALTSSMPTAYGTTSMLLPVQETPISVTTLLPSALAKIQEFLVRGERRQAYHYALDERLWAHAMIIASSIDKEAWKEVVNEFLRAELGAHEGYQRATPHLNGKGTAPHLTNGREWLRVTYSVFSGQGPNAVQELVPTNLLSRAATGLQVPAPVLSHTTPVSPNFSSTASATQIPVESLSKWPEIAATVVSSPLNSEYSATLSTLGDYLLSHHLVEGAHVCYLLSPQTSLIGGLGGPGARLVLVGSQSPHVNPVFFRDPDSIIFTEIAEFALSLKAPTKGQESFHGFPHFQAYKFIRAAYLADIGHIQNAARYCEAITAAMGRPSPYFTPALVEGLRQLADRLLGSPHIDKPSSWISGKVNKPSLDSIGNWLEVRLTKFIAGEGSETSLPASELSKAQFAGPFSSYSSISSATTSASPSPPPAVINSHIMSAMQPPRRSGSAMALPSTTMHIPVDRASSAMEYYRPTRHASPVPPNTAPLHSTGYHYSQYATPPVVNGYTATHGSEPSSRKTSLEITAEEGLETQDALRDERDEHAEDQRQLKVVDGKEVIRDPEDSGGWWNSLSNTDSAPTPTVATFHHVENVRDLGEGFISLMDNLALSTTPNATPSSRHQADGGFDEVDDLGLGNSGHRRTQDVSTKMTEDNPPTESSQDIAKTDEKRDTPAAASAGSWFSRLWKRSDTPGPIKASLGEETSFYYDKELKRWVNKKVEAEVAQPSAPPPPPSRAQTASPSVSNSRYGGISNGTVASARPRPPPRTASAIDLSTSPTSKLPMRVRSGLVPTEVASMPSTPAPSSMPNPPPMGRSRSQAAKKNVRGRYVDVFQEGA